MKKPIGLSAARAAAPRIWSRVNFSDDPAGCWLWTGATSPSGHGRVGFQGTAFYAHRILWVAQYATDPGGNDLDHVCRTPACVRPDHIEAVLPVENVRRGNAKSSHALRTDRCVNGHDLTNKENVYRWRGARLCRPCRRRTSRAYYADRPDRREKRIQYLRAYRAARRAR